jgi:hypothetical protein
MNFFSLQTELLRIAQWDEVELKLRDRNPVHVEEDAPEQVTGEESCDGAYRFGRRARRVRTGWNSVGCQNSEGGHAWVR